MPSPSKVCFVPTCLNTSENSNKVFISIPSNPKSRAKWFSSINIPILGRKDIYCCEDHFDMERDAKNWMHYKLMGGHLFMKKDVFPHKYLVESRCPSEISQYSESARKIKMEMLIGHADKVKKSPSIEKDSNAPSAHEIQMNHFIDFSQPKQIESPAGLIKTLLENKIVQSPASHFVPMSKVNKIVQINIKQNMRSVSTNTDEVLTRSISTTTVSEETTKEIPEIISTEKSQQPQFQRKPRKKYLK